MVLGVFSPFHSSCVEVEKLNSSTIENRFEDLLRFKEFARQNASGAGMFRIIRVDSFDCIDNFAERPKRQKPSFATVDLRESRLLDYDRTTSSEIARTPIAEPASE